MNEAVAPPRSNRSRLIAVVAISLAAGLSFGVWMQSSKVSIEDVDATVLDPAGTLDDFSLVTHEQQAFTLASLRGKWSFVFFGYTYCPDVCPTTLHTLTQVEKQIAESGGRDQPRQVVFVSVDPERDTPERLAEYVPYFNESFIGVTGEQAEINRFTRQLGILHVRMERDGDENYLVNHTTSVLLFNPKGELRALFSNMPHKPKDITENFLKITQL